MVTKEEMRTGLEKLGTLSPEDIETIVAKYLSSYDLISYLERFAKLILDLGLIPTRTVLCTLIRSLQCPTLRQM